VDDKRQDVKNNSLDALPLKCIVDQYGTASEQALLQMDRLREFALGSPAVLSAKDLARAYPSAADLACASETIRQMRLATAGLSPLFASAEQVVRMQRTMSALHGGLAEAVRLADVMAHVTPDAVVMSKLAQSALASEKTIMAQLSFANHLVSTVAGLSFKTDLWFRSQPSWLAAWRWNDACETSRRLFDSCKSTGILSQAHGVGGVMSGQLLPRLASVEYFNASDLVERFSVPPHRVSGAATKASVRQLVHDDTADTIEGALAEIDPELPKLWVGARQARMSANPDSQRHFSISLRELLTQVLHKLAPDDAVAAWSVEPEYFHNGRPKRKARVMYICRSVTDGGMRTFLAKDVAASVSFMELFEAGTHSTRNRFSPEMLSAMEIRAAAAVRFLVAAAHAPAPEQRGIDDNHHI
jgi:hypothetical protein